MRKLNATLTFGNRKVRFSYSNPTVHEAKAFIEQVITAVERPQNDPSYLLIPVRQVSTQIISGDNVPE